MKYYQQIYSLNLSHKIMFDQKHISNEILFLLLEKKNIYIYIYIYLQKKYYFFSSNFMISGNFYTENVNLEKFPFII